MFLLKALYVRIFTLLAMLVTLWGSWQLLQGQWLWLAPMLTWTPLWVCNLWRYHRGNIFYQDEREYPAMAFALLGVGLVLVLGERDVILWSTLAGLFGLLLYVFVASSLTRGVREPAGDKQRLSHLEFQLDSGAPVSLPVTAENQWVFFFHATGCPYARMAMRELLQVLARYPGRLKPEHVVAIFPDQLPGWARELQLQGGRCWGDTRGDASRQLGLWLRGGDGTLGAGQNALRPALAVLGSEGDVKYWEVAKSFRLPPSLQQNWGRLSQL
ncbi:thioredoxin family protein [Aestuariicella hydrocarbonica]|uniref:Thioredoxin family protein n=1 Tax=Pseudomaricurvus hydrocarbonicus TaxID=1470433 RepID=A0A9E5MGR6_9GAMM|nr:thioredoxin family protein [Aestuariicella hydrocarbonica]NHO65046.1 thioredoxin family protein [Aestuariicella hydrocarbonica]